MNKKINTGRIIPKSIQFQLRKIKKTNILQPYICTNQDIKEYNTKKIGDKENNTSRDIDYMCVTRGYLGS